MGAIAARASMERTFYIYYTYYAYIDFKLYKGYFCLYNYCAGILGAEYEFVQKISNDIVKVPVDADRRSETAAAVGTWGSCSAIEYQFL